MRRILAFLGGLAGGATLGTVVALLFAPRSGTAMRDDLQQRWDEAVQAGDDAAEAKRQALQEKLVIITGPHPEGSAFLSTTQSPNGKHDTA